MKNDLDALFVFGYSIIMLLFTILVMKPNNPYTKKSVYFYEIVIWSFIIGLSLLSILISLGRLTH